MNYSEQRSPYRDRFAEQKELFDSVVRAYVEISEELPLITAFSYDPDAPRQRTLTPDAIHFRVDVESATETALRDLPALQRAWFRLACGDKVEAALAKPTVTRCARLYQARSLDPNLYFHRFRIGGLIPGRAA